VGAIMKSAGIPTLLVVFFIGCPAVAQEPDYFSRYVLGAGDQISISVYDEEDLSFELVRLGESGTITYPFLGELRVSGLTTVDLEAVIARGLIDGEFLIQPEVTVSIIQYRPFYIDGEVNNPGGYPFEPGLTLRKAVTLAGGFTERASRSRISIIPEAGAVNAQTQAQRRDDISLETEIEPGDTITIAQRFF